MVYRFEFMALYHSQTRRYIIKAKRNKQNNNIYVLHYNDAPYTKLCDDMFKNVSEIRLLYLLALVCDVYCDFVAFHFDILG